MTILVDKFCYESFRLKSWTVIDMNKMLVIEFSLKKLKKLLMLYVKIQSFLHDVY